VGKQHKILAGKYRIFLPVFVDILDVVAGALPCPKAEPGIYKKDTFIFRRICYTMEK
jgi:hypothetical protein